MDDVSVDPKKKKAPVRLVAPLGWVHEVALVEAGANERIYHDIRKGLVTMADGSSGTLTLPTQAKAQILEAMGALLEQGVALNDTVKAAATSDDPNAVIAPELAGAFDQMGSGWAALAAQYGGDAGAGAGDVAMSAEEQIVVDQAVVELSKRIGKRFATLFKTVQKGRGAQKLTMQQFMKLHSNALLKLLDLVKEVAPFFNGMDDEEETPPPGKGPAQKEQPAAATPPAAGAGGGTPPGPAAGAASGAGAAGAGGVAAVEPTVKSLGEITAALSTLSTGLASVAGNVQKLAQHRSPPNAELGRGAADAGAQRVQGKGGDAGGGKYAVGENMAERVRKQKQTAAETDKRRPTEKDDE